MLLMTSTSKWSSTTNEDRPAARGARLRPWAPVANARGHGCYRRPGERGAVWLERRVIAYVDQGGAWESPSSTLHAIAHAIEAGATGIELDVHATRTVSWWCATTPRSIARRRRTAPSPPTRSPQLRDAGLLVLVDPRRRCDAGPVGRRVPVSGPGTGDPSFGIATLREVLERFPGVVLNLDIKQTAPVVAPYEESLARLLAEFGRTDDVIVASFLDSATDAFRRFAPAVPTSAGTMATAEAWRAVQAGEDLPDIPAVAYQVPERQGDLVVVDERFVQAAHRAGQAVHVWTVNDDESMERLLGLAWTGSSRTCRRRAACRRHRGSLAIVSARRVRSGALGTSRPERSERQFRRRVTLVAAASATAAVRLLAVVGLLFCPELALDRPLRHGGDRLDRPIPGTGRPGERLS